MTRPSMQPKRKKSAGKGAVLTNPQNTSTAAQFPSDNATARLSSNKEDAIRLITRFPSLANHPDVQQIMKTGFLDKAKRAAGGFLEKTGLDQALRGIDSSRRLVGLGIRDVTGKDTQVGKEIGFNDYLNVIFGRDDELIASLGTDLVGEFGDVSMSNLLDLYGWEKSDTSFFANAARFTVSLGGDIVTDPISYVTFGASGLGKKVLFSAAGRTVDDAARATLFRIARQLDDVGESAMEAAMRRETIDLAEKHVYPRMIESRAASLAEGEIITPAIEAEVRLASQKIAMEADRIVDTAGKEISKGVKSQWHAKIIEPLATRDFAALPDEYLTHQGIRNVSQARELGVADIARIDPFTAGGVRFGVPFIPSPKFQGAFSTMPIGATRGLGRKITTPVRKLVRRTAEKSTLGRWAIRHGDDFLIRTDADKALFKAAREGELYRKIQLEDVIGEVVREGGFQRAVLRYYDNVVVMRRAVPDMADDDFDDLLRHAFAGGKVRGEISGARIADLSEEAQTVFVQLVADTHLDLVAAHKYVTQSLGMPGGFIEGYIPQSFVPEFIENVKSMIVLGEIPNIDPTDAVSLTRTASQLDVTVEELLLFAEVAESVTPKLASGKQLGDSRFFKRHNLNRTVIRLGQSDTIYFGEGSLALKQAGTDPKVINDSLVKVHDAIVKRNGGIAINTTRRDAVSGTKLPIQAIEPNSAVAMGRYMENVQTAATELAIINKARKAGLIQDSTFGEIVDKTLHEVAPQFAAAEEIIARIITGREGVLAAIEAAPLQVERISLGGGRWIDAPKGAAKRKGYRNAINRFRRELEKVERHQVDVREAQKKLARRFVQETGMGEAEARQWAAASSPMLVTFRAESRHSAEELSDELFKSITEAVDRGSKQARLEAQASLDQIKARRDELVRAGTDAQAELEGVVSAKMVDEAFDATPVRDFNAFDGTGLIDPEGTARRMNMLVEEVITPNLERQRAAVIEMIQIDIDEILEEAIELGSEEFLDKVRRGQLVHLRARLLTVEAGTINPQAVDEAMKAVNARYAMSLLDDLGDDLTRGVEIMGARGQTRKQRHVLGLIADLTDNPSLEHAIWSDEWVRDALGAGMLDRQPSIVTKMVEGNITKAKLRQVAVDRFHDRYTTRLEQLDQTFKSLHNERIRLSDASGALVALRDGEFATAARHADELSEVISSATGWDGHLSITQIAVGQNRGRWSIQWIPRISDASELPSIREQVKALREGVLTEDVLRGRGLDEVIWFRDLEDTLERLHLEASVRQAEGIVQRTTVAGRTSADTVLGKEAWTRLSPKLDAAMAGTPGAVKRLQSAVQAVGKSGRVRWSQDWLAIERVLPLHQIDELRDKINRLVLSDGLVGPADKQLARWNDAVWQAKKFRPLDEAAQSLNRMQTNLGAQLKAATIAEHRAALEAAQEMSSTLSRVISRAAKADENGFAKGIPNRAAVLDEGFREDLAIVAQLANEIGIDGLARKAKKLYGVNPSDIALRQSEVDSFIRFGEIPERSLQRNFVEGLVPGEAFGLTGSTLEQINIDPLTAILLESMTNNMRALYSPLGADMFRTLGQQVYGYWKGAATVYRPTFHWRNYLSALWNGQIAYTRLGAYRDAFGIGKFRDVINANGSVEDALKTIKNPRVRDAVEQAWNQEIFQSGFGAVEFRNTPGAAFGRKTSGVGLVDAANPLSKEFAPAQAGGRIMTRIEDYMRLATFMSWYDPQNPASARLARDVVHRVHFDYTNLTELERKAKIIAPFFVWSRRNIPLQLELMIERPGLINRYGHLMRNVRDNFGAGGEEFDDYPSNPWLSTTAVGTGIVFNEDTPTWMRVMFDPDLPPLDLERTPFFSKDKGIAGVFSLTEWSNMILDVLGPQVQLPFRLNQQGDYNDVNAPVGLNQVFSALDLVDFWGGIEKSSDGQVQVSYNTRALFETAFPFWNEYTSGLENRPDQMNRLGLPQDPALTDRVRAFLLAQTKGFGFRGQVPADTKAGARIASDRMRDLERKTARGILPDSGVDWFKDLLER